MKLKKLSTLLMVPALAVALAACGGSEKPSKDDVKAGLTQAMENELGTGSSAEEQEAANELLGCLVDETYDKVSAETLQALADGKDPESISEEDNKHFEDALGTCMEKMLADITG